MKNSVSWPVKERFVVETFNDQIDYKCVDI